MAPLLARLGLARSGFGFGKKSGAAAGPFSATGGTIVTPGNGFNYHIFTSPGTFAVSSGTKTMDILIVAGGGGGGGGYYTGGGGAGGVVYGPSISTGSGSYPVVVGPGGTGGPVSGTGTAGNGTPSSFDIVTAIGGGGGGSGPGGPVGQSGGSSGGSGYYDGPPSGLTPQPVPGLYTAYGNNALPWSPGVGNGGGGSGGGGAGRQGGNGQPFPGFEYPIVGLTPIAPVANSPTNNQYGGGGSGGMPDSNVIGGAGGGGYGTTGGTDPSPTITANAVSNTGGGGGGRGNPIGAGGSGGLGVVIIRYQV